MIPAPRARCDNHHCRTLLRIVRVQTLPIDRSNGHAKDRVGVPVKITLIPYTTSVARRKHKNAPLAAAPFLHTVDHCLENQALGRFHALAIVWRTPATRVNVVLLVAIV